METSETIARDFLLENSPHIQMVTWGGNVTNKSSFLDIRNNKEFSQPFKEVKRVLTRNKEAIFGKTIRNTPESYNEKLAALCDHIQVVTYGKLRSIFRDSKRNLEFEEDNKQVLHRLKNPNHLFAPSMEEVVTKRGDAIEAKYGVRHAFHSPELLTKARDTLEQNYGVRSPLHSAIIQEKVTSSHLVKYGETRASKTAETKSKFKETCIAKFGGVAPMQNEAVRDKSKKTCITKYGHTTYNASMEAKLASSKYIVDGVPISTFAESSEYSLVHLRVLARNNVDVTSLDEKGSVIECILKDFFKKNDIKFIHDYKLEGTDYRPDFLLPDHNLIIECDGLYWHSDAVLKDNQYPVKKLEAYESQGYKSLFFRENEIISNFDIVKSIINHKIGKSSIIFARKCSIEHGEPSFFETNHLMGKGSGRVYTLNFNGEVVASMQVKWLDKGIKNLDISRFCTKQGVSVTGGFSKLLSHVIKEEKPLFITNFVDRRYGSGSHLGSLGFMHINTSQSFAWVSGSKLTHRMAFPGNTGYENGYHKMWDCGQSKFMKTV